MRVKSRDKSPRVEKIKTVEEEPDYLSPYKVKVLDLGPILEAREPNFELPSRFDPTDVPSSAFTSEKKLSERRTRKFRRRSNNPTQGPK